MKIAVEFDDPDHGWIGLTLAAGEQHFTDSVSYTPFPSFEELAQALSSILQANDAQAVARWSGEPHFYEFRFSRTGDIVSLRVFHFPRFKHKTPCTEVFAVSGTIDEICRPFWKAVQDLRGKFGDDELTRRIHAPFPGSAYDKIRPLLG